MRTSLLINALIGVGVAVAACSCDENAWNEKLPGWEEPTITEVKSVDYTLTDADYKTLAGLSDNKTLMAQIEDGTKALSLVGTNLAFNDVATAERCAPAFLASSSFPYFALDNGSAVRLTYNVERGYPEAYYQASSPASYKVTADDYINDVWKSDDNYIEGFSPAHPASRTIPALLKKAYPQAEAGQYAVVEYNQAATEPIFGQPQGGGFELSSTVATAANGEMLEVKGIVTAVDARGFVVTDASGSILYYQSSGFDPAEYPVGTQVNVAGTVSNYNCGFQIDSSKEGTVMEKVGKQDYKYPVCNPFTPAQLDQIAADYSANKKTGPYQLAKYGSITGKVVLSGSNINIIVDGCTTAQGSPYQATDDVKAKLPADATVTVEGYVIAVAGGKYVNIVVTNVRNAAAAPARRAPLAEVSLTAQKAAYTFNGTTWTPAADFSVLNPSDYSAMGGYTNVKDMLPRYLGVHFPYAATDDIQYVYYQTSSTGKYLLGLYQWDGTAWTTYSTKEVKTAQFTRLKGVWIYDPNVTITLAAGKGIAASAAFYQTCVDWVKDNIGSEWVTSYGNNEYYAGTSAYQNNVDLRPASARAQYAAGWGDMTDDQILEAMKQHLTEQVFPGALHILYPNAKPIEGLEVVYTINFYCYYTK